MNVFFSGVFGEHLKQILAFLISLGLYLTLAEKEKLLEQNTAF